MRIRHVLIALFSAALVFGACQNDDEAAPQDDDNAGETEDVDDSDAQGWEPEESVTEEERKPLLLVGIDGLKWSYLDTYESSLPNLNYIAEQGVVAESLKPVFPSHTFPNLFSIATGLYPENHGLVANNMYDAEREERFSISNNEAHADPEWFEGEPIWVTAEEQGLVAKTFFWVGSEAPYGSIRPSEYVAYDSGISHGDRTDQVIEWLSDDDPADFATLYFASPDGVGHEHGTDSQSLSTTLDRVDDQIARLINGLDDEGLWPDGINIIFVSDHGMTNLNEDKMVFLDDIIDLRDVHVIDWTPVAMIEPDDGKADDIYDQLASAPQAEHYEVYRKDDIPERYGIRDHHRVPEIIVVADMPYTLTSHSYYEDRGKPSGGHGFDPEYRDMHGVFVGHGPDLPESTETDTLQIVDIYSLMTHLLALDAAEHDGSFERIGSQIYGE